MIIKGPSIHNNSNTLSDQITFKALQFIQIDSSMPTFIGGDNFVNINSFVTTKMLDLNHNSRQIRLFSVR